MTSTGLVPLIRYRDVATAVDWLSATFGFEKRSVIQDPDGTIAYAELSYGHGLVMLGPVGQSVLDALLKQPDELGGIGTQSCYVAVDDVEAHFKHARAAGAEIVLEFGSDEAGDRAYAAKDPEGHVWNFGAYSPWRPLIAEAERTDSGGPDGRPRPVPTRLHTALAAAVAVLGLVTSAAVALIDPPVATSTVAAESPSAPSTATAAAPSDEFRREAESLRASLERETHARREASRTAASVREELERERAARQAAETETTSLKAQLVREREARLNVEPKPGAAATAPSPPAAPEAHGVTAPAAPGPAAASPAAALAATPATSGVANAPQTTGSLGEEHGATAAVTPPAGESPAAAGTAPKPEQISEAQKKERAKSLRQSKAPAAVKKKTKPSGSDDPFFLYD